MKHRWSLLLSLLGVLAFPQPVWANAGTPLMWAGMLHLVFGNALIGLGEGLLLAWLCSVPKGKSVLVMILANYASAWIGALFISGVVRTLPMDLNNGWTSALSSTAECPGPASRHGVDFLCCLEFRPMPGYPWHR